MALRGLFLRWMEKNIQSYHSDSVQAPQSIYHLILDKVVLIKKNQINAEPP
jgi:hypothetical protein